MTTWSPGAVVTRLQSIARDLCADPSSGVEAGHQLLDLVAALDAQAEPEPASWAPDPTASGGRYWWITETPFGPLMTGGPDALGPDGPPDARRVDPAEYLARVFTLVEPLDLVRALTTIGGFVIEARAQAQPCSDPACPVCTHPEAGS